MVAAAVVGAAGADLVQLLPHKLAEVGGGGGQVEAEPARIHRATDTYARLKATERSASFCRCGVCMCVWPYGVISGRMSSMAITARTMVVCQHAGAQGAVAAAY